MADPNPTPTLEELRDHYAKQWDPHHGWLRCTDRADAAGRTIEAAQHEAWDEGARAPRDIYGDVVEPNPYAQHEEV